MCNPVSRRRTSSFAIAALLLVPAIAQSQTTNWTGAAGVNGSGNYNVLGNWDNGIPNGTGFNAVVSTTNGGNPYTITLNSGATVTSLAISSAQATFDHISATYIATTVNVSAGATHTDMDAAYLSRAGIATGLISIPIRYAHSPTELVSLDDVDAAIRLVAAFAARLEPGLDFTR